MDKIFQRAEDKNVAAVIIYKKTAETYAYVDSAYTTKFTTSALKNAFLKGAVIMLGTDSYATPVSFGVSSSVGFVTYITPNGTTATSADIATLTGVADPS